MLQEIKNVLFALLFISSLLMLNISFAEETQPQQPSNQIAVPEQPEVIPAPALVPQPQEQAAKEVKEIKPAQQNVPPIAKLPPSTFRRNLPPAIFVKGKEGELNRVFIENASINQKVTAEFIVFDINPGEKLNPLKPIGIPPEASFDITSSESEKNKAQAVFSWTPTEKDKGLHGFAFEVSNSKGDTNRVALFYDVK